MKILFVNSEPGYSKSLVDLLELKFGQLPGIVYYCQNGDELIDALPENEPVIVITEVAIAYAGQTTLEGGAFKMIQDAKKKNPKTWAILYTVSFRAFINKDLSIFDCTVSATFDDKSKDALHREVMKFAGISI
jgi:DNA-binding NarL/FixJ family response regulator